MQKRTFILVLGNKHLALQAPWLAEYTIREVGVLGDKAIAIGCSTKLPKINPNDAFMLSTDSKFQSFKRTGNESLAVVFNASVEIYPLFEITPGDHEELFELEEEYDSAIEAFKRACGVESMCEAYGYSDEWLCLPEGTRVFGKLDSFYQSVEDLEKLFASHNDYVLSYVDSSGHLTKSGGRRSCSESAPSVGLVASWPSQSGNGLRYELLVNRAGVFLEQTDAGTTLKPRVNPAKPSKPSPPIATSRDAGVELTIVEAQIRAPTPEHAFGVAKLSGWVRNTTDQARQIALQCAVKTAEGTLIGLKSINQHRQSWLDSDSEENEVFPKSFAYIPADSKMELEIEFDIDLLDELDQHELRMELLAACYRPLHSDSVLPRKRRLFKTALQEECQLVLHRPDLAIARNIATPSLLRIGAVNDDCQLPVRWSIEMLNSYDREMLIGTKVNASTREEGFYSENRDLEPISPGETRLFVGSHYFTDEDINKTVYFEWPFELWHALGRVSCTCTTRIVNRAARPLEQEP